MSEPLEASLSGLMSSVGDSPVSLIHLPLEGAGWEYKTPGGSGLKCSALLAVRGPLGLLLRMLLSSTEPHSERWYLTWKASVTKSPHRWKFRLVPSDTITGGRASGFSATPTATANQGAPSMQKHPGCRGLEMTPEAWERRMGYPEGWTDIGCVPSVTQSSRRSPSGSRTGSKKPRRK